MAAMGYTLQVFRLTALVCSERNLYYHLAYSSLQNLLLLDFLADMSHGCELCKLTGTK